MQIGPGWLRPAHRRSVATRRRAENRGVRPDFKIKGLRRRCAPKHRNNRRETAGWDRVDRQEVSVLCCHGPGRNTASRPVHFRGCGSTAECLRAMETVRVRFPAAAPISSRRAPACAAGSPKPSGLGAAPRRRAISMGKVRGTRNNSRREIVFTSRSCAAIKCVRTATARARIGVVADK